MAQASSAADTSWAGIAAFKQALIDDPDTPEALKAHYQAELQVMQPTLIQMGLAAGGPPTPKGGQMQGKAATADVPPPISFHANNQGDVPALTQTQPTQTPPFQPTGNWREGYGPMAGEKGIRKAEEVGRRLMHDLPKHGIAFGAKEAAAVTGNFLHESWMNPNVNEFGWDPTSPDFGPPNKTPYGYGWAQWSAERKQRLIEFAHSKGMDPGTEEANYAFLMEELRFGEKDMPGYGKPHKVLALMKAAATPEEAAIVFRGVYERAANPVDPNRTAAAQLIFNRLTT